MHCFLWGSSRRPVIFRIIWIQRGHSVFAGEDVPIHALVMNSSWASGAPKDLSHPSLPVTHRVFPSKDCKPTNHHLQLSGQVEKPVSGVDGEISTGRSQKNPADTDLGAYFCVTSITEQWRQSWRPRLWREGRPPNRAPEMPRGRGVKECGLHIRCLGLNPSPTLYIWRMGMIMTSLLWGRRKDHMR